MIPPKNPSNLREADVDRTTEDIRRVIAEEIESIAQTIEQIGGRINQKLDWREYVHDYPYWALGVAAGLGYLTSGMFPIRSAPGKLATRSSAADERNSPARLFTVPAGSSLITSILLGVATKAAVGWITTASSTVAEKKGETS